MYNEHTCLRSKALAANFSSKKNTEFWLYNQIWQTTLLSIEHSKKSCGIKGKETFSFVAD